MSVASPGLLNDAMADTGCTTAKVVYFGEPSPEPERRILNIAIISLCGSEQPNGEVRG